VQYDLLLAPYGGNTAAGRRAYDTSIRRAHGKLGFDEMTQSMTIVDDWLSFTRKDLWWHPFSHGIYQGLKGILHLLYGPGLLKRISGGWAMMKILPRIFRTK